MDGDRATGDRVEGERTIALLTDFGQGSAFVGMVKGVVLSINPRARMVDLCHDVCPQEVRQAAFLLKVSERYFPEGTIHVAVVDPGVGSERRGLAVRARGRYFVGPDNGVLSWAADPEAEDFTAVVLDREDLYIKPVSATFHGRDVFAPIAAHLSLGMPLESLGAQPLEIVQLPPPRVQIREDSVEGEVLDIDRFGNLTTSIPEGVILGDWPPGITVEAGPLRISGLQRTYADAGHREFIAYVGSVGFVEIGQVRGNAASASGCRIGSPVCVRVTREGGIDPG